MVSHSPRWLVHSGSAPTRCLGSTGRTENKYYVVGPVPDSVLSVFAFLSKITTETIRIRPHDIPTFPEIRAVLSVMWQKARYDTLHTASSSGALCWEVSLFPLLSVNVFFNPHNKEYLQEVCKYLLQSTPGHLLQFKGSVICWIKCFYQLWSTSDYFKYVEVHLKASIIVTLSVQLQKEGGKNQRS